MLMPVPAPRLDACMGVCKHNSELITRQEQNLRNIPKWPFQTEYHLERLPEHVKMYRNLVSGKEQAAFPKKSRMEFIFVLAAVRMRGRSEAYCHVFCPGILDRRSCWMVPRQLEWAGGVGRVSVQVDLTALRGHSHKIIWEVNLRSVLNYSDFSVFVVAVIFLVTPSPLDSFQFNSKYFPLRHF